MTITSNRQISVSKFIQRYQLRQPKDKIEHNKQHALTTSGLTKHCSKKAQQKYLYWRLLLVQLLLKSAIIINSSGKFVKIFDSVSQT